MPHVAAAAALAASTAALTAAAPAAFGTAVAVSSIVASAAIAGVAAGAQAYLAGRQKQTTPKVDLVFRQERPLGQVVYGTCRVAGPLAFFRNGDTGASDDDLLMVMVLACHEIDDLLEVWDGDKRIWTKAGGIDSAWTDDVETLEWRAGTDNQVALPNLLGPLPDTLDATFRLRGHAYLYVRLRNFAKKWKGRLPALWARVRGAKVLDPRSGVTAWSDNWALCVRDYLLRERGGAGWAAAELDAGAVIAAANVSDEDVALKGGGTQKRYRLNGAFPATGSRPVVEDMLRYGAGELIDTGLARIVAGAYAAPVRTLGPDDFVAVPTLDGARRFEERVDGVKTTFANPEAFFREDDAPAITFEDYDPALGSPLLIDWPLEREESAERAQRLGVLAAKQARRQLRLRGALAAKHCDLEPGDRVTVVWPWLGLNHVMEVRSVAPAIEPGGPAVEVELLEDGATFWSWNPNDADQPPIPKTSTLPSPRTVAPPTGVTVIPGRVVEDDGTISTFVDVYWTASPDRYLDYYRVRYIQFGASQTIQTTDVFHRIYGISRNTVTSIRVAAVNTLGVTSAEAAPAGDVTPTGDVTAPPTPTIAGAERLLRRGRLQITASKPKDWSHFALYGAPVGSAFASAVYMGAYATDVVSTPVLPIGGSERYWVTSVDRTGNASPPSNHADVYPKAIDDGEIETDAVRVRHVRAGELTVAAAFADYTPRNIVKQAAWVQLGFVWADRSWGGFVDLRASLKVTIANGRTDPVKFRFRELYGLTSAVVQGSPRSIKVAAIDADGEVQLTALDLAPLALDVTRFDLEVWADNTGMIDYTFDDVEIVALVAKRSS